MISRPKIKLSSLVLNIFCKTGQGGGIDPTCSGSSSASTPQGQGALGPDYSLTGHRRYTWKVDGEKAGEVMVEFQSSSSVRLEQLGIEKKYEGRGHAKQMYRELFQELKGMGVKEVLSGFNQTPGGKAVWTSLMKSGLPIKFTPGTGGFRGTKDLFTLDLTQL